MRNSFAQHLVAAVCAALCTVGTSIGFAYAESMSSTNFKVQNDTLSIGGRRSTSATFIAEDAVGEDATGENLSSTNFNACAGFSCFRGAQYLSMTIGAGTSSPGVSGSGVSLGSMSTSAVTTSNGTTVGSVFFTVSTNAERGVLMRIQDLYGGLKRASTSDIITSASTTLVAGTAGYGACVFSATQDADSPGTLAAVAPFNGTCTKTTGHAVGAIAGSASSFAQSSRAIKGGVVELLIKASISGATPVANDYTDTLIFILSSTF